MPPYKSWPYNSSLSPLEATKDLETSGFSLQKENALKNKFEEYINAFKAYELFIVAWVLVMLFAIICILIYNFRRGSKKSYGFNSIFDYTNDNDLVIEKYIFDAHDINGDGYLDRDEFKAFIREMTERNAEPDQMLIDAIMQKIDTNHDVKIDYKEFKQFTETM